MRIVTALALFVAAAAAAAPQQPAPLLPYRVVAEYPHDTAAFTEGLAMDGESRLIESVGQYGRSALVLRDLVSGRPLKVAHMVPGDFGEGATVVGRHIVQLTWREGRGYVYDMDLNPVGHFQFPPEGWGLTYDGRRLIQSDGSSMLYLLDPQTYAASGHIAVHDGDAPVYELNELEYARGRIYANVWHSDRVAEIDPDSGRVTHWIDLSALRKRFIPPPGWNPSDDVLNGIAYDPRKDRFYVTGKCWPKLFAIELGKGH